MSEGQEIPEDIMEYAMECLNKFRWSNDDRWHFFIAEAILNERHRHQEQETTSEFERLLSK
jgi:hypothetical protein